MAKTILIVEDNELNMKLFSDVLQIHGFEILKSVDGSDAIQLATEHHPDLILMDIQLPELSGIDLTKTLKADNDLKDIPVIALTAHIVEEKGEIMSAGFDAYLSKPIVIPTFLGMIAEYIKWLHQ